MFKPCPNCGFLVALISGREASQRCPRCGSGLLEEGDVLSPAEREALPARRPEARRPSRADETPDAALRGGAALPQAGPDGAADDAAAPLPERPPMRGADARGGAADVGGRGAERSRASAPVDEAATATHADTHHPVTADADADHAAGGDAEPAPSFAARRRDTPRRVGRRWPWAVALPLLASTLALQLLLSQRVELAADARWRPVVAAACGVLGCDVPAWREPRAFSMLARNVRPHGSRAGVLHVSTSLRNDARWPQPLPVVVLSLSDLDGRVLAARAVGPAEYGRPAPVLVAPGDSVDIAFDVREPSPRVVSFDFQLR